jgi:hypothetical protein
MRDKPSQTAFFEVTSFSPSEVSEDRLDGLTAAALKAPQRAREEGVKFDPQRLKSSVLDCRRIGAIGRLNEMVIHFP